MLAVKFPDDRFKRAYHARQTMIKLSTDLVKQHRRNLAAAGTNGADGKLPNGAHAGAYPVRSSRAIEMIMTAAQNFVFNFRWQICCPQIAPGTLLAIHCGELCKVIVSI